MVGAGKSALCAGPMLIDGWSSGDGLCLSLDFDEPLPLLVVRQFRECFHLVEAVAPYVLGFRQIQELRLDIIGELEEFQVVRDRAGRQTFLRREFQLVEPAFGVQPTTPRTGAVNRMEHRR